MKFSELVSADRRPDAPMAATRSFVHTDTREMTLSADTANAGFLRSLGSRKKQRFVQASRRSFLQGTVFAASAAIATGATKFGPAKTAVAQGEVGSSPYRIYTACPSYAAPHDCNPGCGVGPICFDCCDANGFFRNDEANGYRITPGECYYGTSGQADGWLWAYNQPCGNCSSIEYRCHDGNKLVDDGSGSRIWVPYICRAVTFCGSDPIAPPTATPPPTLSYSGKLASAINNGNGTASITGWVAAVGAQGSVAANFGISVAGVLVQTGPASLPYQTGVGNVGANHGFATEIGNLAAGTHSICLGAWDGATLNNIECLNLVTTNGSTAPTSTAVPQPTAVPTTPPAVTSTAAPTLTPIAQPTPTPSVTPTPQATPTPTVTPTATTTATPTPTPSPTVTPTATPTPAVPLALPGPVVAATKATESSFFAASGVLEVLRRDTAGQAFASGWGCDRSKSGSVTVVATVNGVDAASATTLGNRADITDFNNDYENARGFTVGIPLPKNSAAQVCVYLEDQTTGDRFPLGCRQLAGG